MLTTWLILDVSSAPLPNAADYLDGTVRAPGNYKDPAKIADYIREKEAERLEMAAVDLDLARITGIAGKTPENGSVVLCRDEDAERTELRGVASWLELDSPIIITFGGLNFDLPLLMRRARYLGVSFPAINLDRYKSKHVDLIELLSDRNPQRRRSLDFYCKRFGWDDLCPKPLTGAEESQVPVTGRWDELKASLTRDVEAIYRLAVWLDIPIQPKPVMSAEQELVGF